MAPMRELIGDRVLLCTLVLGFALTVHGAHWGRVESWNPDQMALLPLGGAGARPLQPHDLTSPPFHTYLNYLLVRVPVESVAEIVQLSPQTTRHSVLIGSRILTALLFLAIIAVCYLVTRTFFGRFPARLVALLLATSAGYVAFAHFLTADIPLTFWMLLSLYFSSRIITECRLGDYVLAGLLAGVAAATKYNGLAIGIALVSAHVLAQGLAPDSWRRMVFSRNLALGLLCVPVGFIAANPYAILTPARFYEDFLYTYRSTPVYEGVDRGHSYLDFFGSFPELVGVPGSLLLGVAGAFALVYSLRETTPPVRKQYLWVVLSVFLLYYARLAAFPRWETRFTLPIVPFILLLSAPLWSVLPRKVALTLAVPLIGYGLICSAYVGIRFLDDPRLEAQEWLVGRVPDGAVVESTFYSPRWALLDDFGAQDIRMPFIRGRVRLMEKALAPFGLTVRESDDVSWFRPSALEFRKPDYVALNSLYYKRFANRRTRAAYPEVNAFFVALLEESMPYRIVFDRSTPRYPWWLYPRAIDFLKNRMVILERMEP